MTTGLIERELALAVGVDAVPFAYLNHAITEHQRLLSALSMTTPRLQIEDQRVAPSRVPQYSDVRPASGPVHRATSVRSFTGGHEAKDVVKQTTNRKLLTYQLAAVVVCLPSPSRDQYSQVLVTVCCPRGDRIPTPTLLQNFLQFQPRTCTIDTTVLADSDLYRSAVQH